MSKLLIQSTVVALAACSQYVANNYQCTFENLQGVYFTTGAQLDKKGVLIFVHREGREFAFNRHDIKLCEKIVVSHTEGLTPP